MHSVRVGYHICVDQNAYQQRTDAHGNIHLPIRTCLYLRFVYGTSRLFADTFADEMRMIAAGLTGGSVYFITENTALGMMQATNVAILISVTPLLATLVGMAVFRSERTKRPERVILGSVVAMVGVVVILWNGGDFAAFNPCGTALTFSAALSWAVYSLFVKKLSQRYDNVFISRKVFGYGLLSMAVWVPFFHPTSFRLEQLLVPTVFFNILFLGLVASMLCFTLWNAVVRHLGMVRASNYINFNAVATFVAAFLILGEHVFCGGSCGFCRCDFRSLACGGKIVV